MIYYDCLNDKILSNAQKIQDILHAHPELSYKESFATKLIKEQLVRLGIDIIDVGTETGVIALLKCKKDGANTVALRADIDAIETQDGAAHLCGHDYHTAALLCCAEYLAENINKLCNNVLFIFQPAEETTTGAASLIKNGLFKKLETVPDVLFGLHNRPEMADGTVRVQSGALMAGKSDFEILIKGKTGHSGSPHQCVDPIVASAAVIQAVQTIVSRNTSPFEPCVCAVCSVHGGTEANFAPESVKLTGSIRTLNDDVHAMCENRLKAVANEVCTAYGCTCDIKIQRLVPVLYNTEKMTELAYKISCSAVGKDRTVTTPPCMGSEDFSVLGRYVPYYFFWVGSGDGGDNPAPWHSRGFCVGKDFLRTAAAVYIACAMCKP